MCSGMHNILKIRFSSCGYMSINVIAKNGVLVTIARTSETYIKIEIIVAGCPRLQMREIYGNGSFGNISSGRYNDGLRF